MTTPELWTIAYVTSGVINHICAKQFDLRGNFIKEPGIEIVEWLLDNARELSSAVQEIERRAKGVKEQKVGK